MGKNTKYVTSFIEDLSDAQLSGFPSQAGTIARDTDFRLDMQGLTSGSPQHYNLQVQINNQTRITSLKKAAPRTVAKALVPTDGSWTPQQIRNALISTINV